jgi:D-tyrosyl-tRNA(Tyr) deacylase
MKIILQRVTKASVTVNKQEISRIGRGYLLLLGIHHADTEDTVKIAIEKIAKLRLFSDEDGKMNLDIQTVSGEILVVSQFTLYANTQKGNRPSFIEAARPEQAIPLYDFFLKELAKFVPVQAGIFGADMQVELINDGPVTMQLEFY